MLTILRINNTFLSFSNPWTTWRHHYYKSSEMWFLNISVLCSFLCGLANLMYVPNLTFIGPCILIYFYSKTNYMHQCIKFILFRNDTPHVSDDLSVHHQEFKTVHTATGICQTDTAVCLLAGRQQYLFDKCLLQYVQSWTPDDGWKDRPKHVECYSNKINLRHSCI